MEKKKIIASAAVVAAIVLGATFTAVGGKFKQERKGQSYPFQCYILFRERGGTESLKNW